MKWWFQRRRDAHGAAVHAGLMYLTVGLLWVAITDHLLGWLTHANRVLTLMQTYKGWLFITATAALVYGLVYFHVRRLLAAEQERHRSEEARQAAETQARQRELELAHASRLIVMGELASGLAHELTQPLGAILHYGEAGQEILRRAQGQAEAPQTILAGKPEEAMDAMVAQARRGLTIVSRLRDFARKQTPRPEPLNVNRLVRDSTALLSMASRGQGVSLEMDLQADLPQVRADPVQLQQVLVNLGSNAVEAADAARKSDGGGRAWVKWRTWRDEDRLFVSVRDSGGSLPAGSDERLFESFFTTKPTGLGLGLPISRSIIEGHGGRLTHRSGEGWTEFQFHLPIVDGSPCKTVNDRSCG